MKKLKLIDKKKPAVYFIPPLINEYETFIPINRNYYKELLPYYLVSSMGRVYNYYLERFLTLNMADAKDGRCNSRIQVHLQFCNSDGESYSNTIFVHRIMMVSFNYIPGCENLEVDHKDGVYYHNYLSNLEWVTKEENIRRAMKKGLMYYPSGENHPEAKHTDEQVILICQLLSENRYSYQQIAEISNTDAHFVSFIARRKGWTNISKYYYF